MKKYLIIILIFILGLFLLFGKKSKEVEKMEEKRFIFISYIELAKYLNDKEETIMKNTIDDMINQCKDFGFTDIILQVRSFSDAIYYSDIFPSSITIVAKEGDKLPFDVLDYFIKISHKNNIRLHIILLYFLSSAIFHPSLFQYILTEFGKRPFGYIFYVHRDTHPLIQ